MIAAPGNREGLVLLRLFSVEGEPRLLWLSMIVGIGLVVYSIEASITVPRKHRLLLAVLGLALLGFGALFTQPPWNLH